MATVPLLFAKLAALYKEIKNRPESILDFDDLCEYLGRFSVIRDGLKDKIPDLYYDLPHREIPETYVDMERRRLLTSQLIRDIDYILELHANSEIGLNQIIEDRTTNEAVEKRPKRVFISHGRSPDWREVQAYIEKDLNIPTLELAQEPNKGRTVLQKLAEESEQCAFATVVMTGDDQVDAGPPRARENVLHEIGFFQGKFGIANVCLLHEEGTNIPSNIQGLVYIPFPKGLISATFSVLARELRSALAKMT